MTDDLVTGGLGADGMLGKRPGYADPLHPTAAELRRAALFQPGSVGQGFGRLFGPDVDETTGQKIPGQGKVAGEEHLAYADDGEGKQNVAMLLQIPASLSSDRRCLIAIPVNGSAGLFRDVVDFATGASAAAARSSTPTRATGTVSTCWSRTRSISSMVGKSRRPKRASMRISAPTWTTPPESNSWPNGRTASHSRRRIRNRTRRRTGARIF